MKNNWRKIEITIYILATAIIISIPVFDHPNDIPDYWFRVSRDIKRLLPFIILFYINAEFLVPKYLLNKKYAGYFTTVVFSIGVVLLLSYLWNYHNLQPAIEGHEIPGRPLPPDDFRPPRPTQNFPPKRFNLWIFNQALINILVVGLGTGLKMSYYWFINERDKKELEKEHLKSELAFLKTQISPHFFLNTLNNIHALTEINVKEAQRAILELSKMMRYLLYESEQGNTTLSKEIEFLKSYIELMRRRIDDKVDISVSLPENVEGILIPPLLFISFVENAFKYGVSYKNDSFIRVELLLISTKELLFTCTNSLHDRINENSNDSGIGLINIKKRLSLLFKDEYSLHIEENNKEYKVILKIPIYENQMHSH